MLVVFTKLQVFVLCNIIWRLGHFLFIGLIFYQLKIFYHPSGYEAEQSSEITAHIGVESWINCFPEMLKHSIVKLKCS